MSVIETAINALKIDEGFRQFMYFDTLGIPSIGFGRNLRDQGMSEAEAEVLLRNDVLHAVTNLMKLDFWTTLSDARQAVLINMTVNMGFDKLMKFDNMIAALRDQDYHRAADEMLDSKWATQVHGRADQLAAAMRNG